MSIPGKIRDYLRQRGGNYRARVFQGADSFAEAVEGAGLPASRVAEATVLSAGPAYLMIVHPADHEVDIPAIEQLFRRSFERASGGDLAALFPDCDDRALPPVAAAYGLRAVVDPRLEQGEEVYFSLGRLGAFVRTDGQNFRRLMGDAPRRIVAYRRAEQQSFQAQEPLSEQAGISASHAQMKQRVEQLRDLPPMPGIATQVLRLRNNPYAHVSELAAIIEQDPSLSAQVIRYASSPFYGYQGRVDSVAMAVARVLGMDFVLDLAFGLSLGKSFRNPAEGPVGLDAFWRHATHAAALTQALCNEMEYLNRPSPGIAYLSGLLHNFGFLLLGHLFPNQFSAVNEALAAAPERPVREVEREVMGMTHTELGLWLVEAWDMPVEIIEAVREHHDPDYEGDFAVYPNLVYLANVLLSRHGIGDSESGEMPRALLERVGLTAEKAEAALESVMAGSEALDFMAGKMAA
jgi:HD-like signal output (HDOD) protein/prolyl-tRNA editing enzyme YbaK/EbsC (Cys-tRNA(Pro) deacylase)